MQTALNIAIALALLFVVVVLGMGLWNMLKGGPGNTSQKLMRLRVAGQAVALILLLGRIQNDLFDVGSDLATPGADEPDAQYPALRIRPVQTEFLEKQIDHYNGDLEPLRSFILPGGTPLAAALHVARTVTRRAERVTVELAAAEPDTSPEALRYLNRLSDLLFVLSRVANANGTRDVLWVPGNYGDVKKGG